MKSRSDRRTRKYQRLAYRAPETNHGWRLTGDYLARAERDGRDGQGHLSIIANAFRMAENDQIWLFHHRVGENHFELWIAPKKMRTIIL